VAAYSLYPGFVKIRYTGNGHVHYQTLPVRPFVAVGGMWYLEKKNEAGGGLWTAEVDAWVIRFKAFLNTADEVQVAHLWTVDEGTNEATFQEEYNIAAAGTSASAAVANGQAVFTMRTTLGGLARIYVMEGYQLPNVKAYPPFAAGVIKNLTDYAKANGSFLVGRDGAFLSSVVSSVSKTNDALRKKFLLAQ
jgi:hypothetical protein